MDTVTVTGELTLEDWKLALVDLEGEAHAWDPLPLFIGFSDVTWDPSLVSFDMMDAPTWVEFTDITDLSVVRLLDGPRGDGLYLFGLQTVPEPGTLTLFGLGSLGLVLWALRRRRGN